MRFAPIAIVGRACRLPGADSPDALLAMVRRKSVVIDDAPPDRWRVPFDHVVTGDPSDAVDRAWSRKGGYVEDFEFDAHGFGADPEHVRALDPLFHWVLDCGRRALADAGLDVTPMASGARIGVVLGNLSLPTSGLSRFAEQVWLGELAPRCGVQGFFADRFMSGAPARLLLGGQGRAFALDAACASSLYAIELACRELHEGRADRMLAGAVNRADDLFLHVGFSALGALSRTGRSRPFHAHADGLIPAEGAGFVVLERLDDAVRAGHPIHGVIRGVGLANDGRGRGILAPSAEGQARSMRAALQMAGLRPEDIGYIECHATGTPIGDGTELRSMEAVYGHGVPIGSLKANIGHAITAAGIAGLIKLLEVLREGELPPTPLDAPSEALDRSPFEVLDEPRPWQGPRRAALSAFGFGGNNAHLIVEAHEPGRCFAVPSRPDDDVVIVAMGARVGGGQSLADFERVVFDGAEPGVAETVRLPIGELRFPPNDLRKASGQQTLLLAACLEATRSLTFDPARTGVFVGYQCDPEIARWGARWRARAWGEALGAGEAWVRATRDAFAPALEAAHVVGTLPNMPANRLSSQLDLTGPSHTVAAEVYSGVEALAIGVRAIARGDLESAIVGAVDLSNEPVHRTATGERTADAAVVLVLRRRRDAEREGLAVLAQVSLETPQGPDGWDLCERIGRPFAASALLEVAAATLRCARGLTREGRPVVGAREEYVRFGEVGLRLWTDTPPTTAPTPQPLGPCLELPAHPPPVVLPDLSAGTRPRGTTMQKMAPAPSLPPVASPGDDSRPDAVPSARRASSAPRTPPAAQAPFATVASASAPPSVTTTREPNGVAPESRQPPAGFLTSFVEYQRRLGEIHRTFLAQQAALHQHFIQTTATPPALLRAPTVGEEVPRAKQPTGAAMSSELLPPPTVRPAPVRVHHGTGGVSPLVAPQVTRQSAPPVPKPTSAGQLPAQERGGDDLPLAFRPRGPSFSRSDLEVHAGGRISHIFGPLFEQQDDYPIQVRMPEPPLLLADRCTGIDAEPGTMGKGTCWTETDVRADSWYLQHDGHMPAGIMIESGQADLFLISWLGADFLNKGQRAYRLLGCEMTWLGDLPKVGDTLAYDIHIDGHAKQGDVRLFFFHYDCWVRQADGTIRPALKVRHGQAGFFTEEELADSAGILWTPQTQEIRADARVDPPAIDHGKRSFSRDQLEAFAGGEPWRCFGPAFDRTKTHTRTPRIQSGRMLFVDEITDFDPRGGPWGRGYLKGVARITPDQWFFDGHFKNDPCMPGTLMLEGCVQTMAFYLSALGYTVDRDGWRFQPVTDETYKLLCRGQVTPRSKELTYEISVEEVHDGPEPTLYADLLCTVDGLGAFHARRFGLKLVPSWPLSSPDKKRLAERSGADPCAAVGRWQDTEHRFDYASLLACAWGQPSTAFGPMYARFDGSRRTPRLPGPPYHFLTRVTKVEGAMGELETDCEFEFEYEVPPDAWYFEANGARVMPFAVLLEAALQPCGWIASYVGSTLTSDSDLLFRNLDGTGTIKTEVFPDSGTLRTVVRNKSISRSAGMIIVSFDVRCFLGEREVYELDTVFGFFPPSAFENQAGLPAAQEQQSLHDAPSNILVNLASETEPYHEGSLRLASSADTTTGPVCLRMIDRVTYWDPHGGAHGLGCVRAEKDIDAGEWFFKAHFYQDPVQPGSLGIEAMLQAMQFHMLQAGMGAGMPQPRFEPIATNAPHTWKYRGQVVPENEVVTTTLEIVEVGSDEAGRYAFADCSLWVDGKRIYEAKRLGMRIVPGDGPEDEQRRPDSQPEDGEERLDPTRDRWLRDHAPTHTLPALPMMSVVDRLLAAARRHVGEVHGLRDVRMERWVVVDGPTRLKTEVEGDEVRLLVWREAPNPKLSRFEVAARARMGAPDDLEPFAPLDEPLSAVPNPYEADALFHGPSFHFLRHLVRGPSGSVGVLDAGAGDVPFGTAHQGLLDAATHVLPHDELRVWAPEVDPSLVAYPHRLDLRLDGPAPVSGEVRCEARFLGFDDPDTRRFPVFRLRLTTDDGVFADMRLVEVLMPKGRLGGAAPRDRRRFLRDGEYVPALSLSTVGEHETTLELAEVRRCDWLPGTVRTAYGVASEDVLREVAIKDHIAARLHIHPRLVEVRGDDAGAACMPLTRHRLEVSGDASSVRVRDGSSELDIAPVADFWRRYFGVGPWPVEDIYYALLTQFVEAVHVTDPEAHARLRGRGVLYLGNHQVGIESLLFSVITGALQGVPTLTLAKAEHRQSWLGKLIAHCFRYPGVRDPGVIAYFDRRDPASLPKLLGSLVNEADAKSLMVHVEGTRAHTCRIPVQTMSGTFCDLAIKAGLPIVPVKFSGGLPIAPTREKLEYPIGMTRQDYWLGAPILPEELAELGYKERIERILDAINNLGPSPKDEVPGAPNLELVDRVSAWMARTETTVGLATIVEVLEHVREPSEAVTRLLEGKRRGRLTTGASPTERWLGELARLLYGPLGPTVE